MNIPDEVVEKMISGIRDAMNILEDDSRDDPRADAWYVLDALTDKGFSPIEGDQQPVCSERTKDTA